MPAHHGEHAVEALGQVDRSQAALLLRADCDDARDPGIGGALHHRVEFLAEIRKIQMSVCVVKIRHRLAKCLAWAL